MSVFMSIAERAVKTASLAAFVWLGACAPGANERPRTSPAADETRAKIAEAETQVRRGHYLAFKKAAAIYEDLYTRPEMKRQVAYPYVRSLVLLLIRERQIGIQFGPDARRARTMVNENPSLREMAPPIDMADFLTSRSRGIQTDIISAVTNRLPIQADRKLYRAELKAKAAAEDYYAYLYVIFFGAMGYSTGETREDPSSNYALFPQSNLMKYANAVRTGKEKPEILEQLVLDDPEFYEAHFHLGELALAERSLLKAENQFLTALPGLRDSPEETIYLASIYTATEEFEKSLDFYDRTLALSPEYRDALLGKAICLSYLGRYTDAIETLGRMVNLGYWLLGEAHYWLAWNYHELREEAQAQAHIEESKGRLPTNSEVFGLAGMIALNRNEIDRAEKEFKEALKYNPANAEALFGLGRVSGAREKWLDAAGYYEQAAEVLGRSEASVQDRIAEIKTALLSEERRRAMLSKKENQLRVVQATKAEAFLDTATSWLNAGLRDRALPWAEKAAAHAQFKDRAAALIAKIKG